jgi:glutaredoxin
VPEYQTKNLMSNKNYEPSIEVISKRGCHLCEQAIDVLLSLKSSHSFDFSISCIEDDSNLFDKYWIKVPVVRLNGNDVFEAEDLANPIECRAKLEKLVLSPNPEKA